MGVQRKIKFCIFITRRVEWQITFSKNDKFSNIEQSLYYGTTDDIYKIFSTDLQYQENTACVLRYHKNKFDENK